jgi:transposase
MPMICSSVKRLRLMLWSSKRARANIKPDQARGATSNGTMPNNPPKANWIRKKFFSPYRDRNAIERMFCIQKDFRRIVTRYECLAVNFLAVTPIAATAAYLL